MLKIYEIRRGCFAINDVGSGIFSRTQYSVMVEHLYRNGVGQVRTS